MRRAFRLGVFAAVGLLAVTNSLWLFPHEGDQRYAYERVEVAVENGTLAYPGKGERPYHRENDLVDVACQPTDRGRRACAFDRYLAAEGPVTVRDDPGYGSTDHVALDGAYYRRTEAANGSRATYGVERVPPRRLLAVAAVNLTGVDPAVVDDGDSPPYRAAVTGERVTTYAPVDADRVGRLYRRNGRYYTVVLADAAVVDRPLVAPPGRDPLTLVGAVLLLVVGVLGARQAVGRER